MVSAAWDDCGILYSQCWEDPGIARIALRVPRGGRVLTIGAAGDNALALLLDEPSQVIAIDVNPAQTALIELKRAALQHLSAPEVGPFLGNGEHPDRTGLFDRIRPNLSAGAAQWWDVHPEAIRRGAIHAGRFERYLTWFRRWVLPFVPGRSAVNAMLSARDLPQQRNVYHHAWDSLLWRRLIRTFFGQRLLSTRARHPAMFAQCQIEDVGGHYLDRARHALTEVSIKTNPYLTYMLRGRFDHDGCTPQYLQQDALPRLSGLADRLNIQVASLWDTLQDLPDRSIDAFYLSDVFELFETSDYEQTLAELARVGRPGARICYWNNLVDRQRPASLSGLLTSHADEAGALHRQDRAFLYSRFVVESVRAPACPFGRTRP
jgi:S-adenosylmethionine-diacylglycerol 3-amino-3-carboxypropyl transferase